jgi:polyhydroxybutyrate depolymerase
MKLHRSLFLLITLLVVSCSSLQAATVDSTAGWHESSLDSNGKTRYFRYFVPENLAQRPATVLVFHGGTRSMRKIFRRRAGGSQEWQQLAEQNGFLLLAPNGTNIKDGNADGDRQSWNDCRVAMAGNNSSSQADDVGFAKTLLAWAEKHFRIEPSRVYATGASNGGMMTLRIITEMGDKIAAAAVFIANQPEKTDCAEPTTAVPLMIMNGTDDPLIPWQGGQILDEGPVLLSTAATLDYWLDVNRADRDRATTVQLADIDHDDDSVVIKTQYPAKQGGQPLWFYEVRGGGHTMPSIKHDVAFLAKFLVGKQNKDLEATHEAWDFLRRFTKPSIKRNVDRH